MGKIFVSYATEYDMYTGYKNWNELTLGQRLAIAEYEFGFKEDGYEEYIIGTGLKKLQAQGIRALYVASLMLNERMGLIKNDAKTSNERQIILSVFANTKFFKEINELLQGRGEKLTDYDGVELERLAQSGTRPSVLDEIFDISNIEAKEFINKQLEVLHMLNAEPLEPKKNVESVFDLKLNSTPKSSSSFLDYFVCDEVRWVRVSIRDFFNRYSDNFMISAVVEKECLRVASNADKAKYSIRVNRMTPEQMALLIIRNVAYENLIYGQNHIYRGVLSLNGKEYKKLFLAAAHIRVNCGFVTREDANLDISEMMSVVKEVG